MAKQTDVIELQKNFALLIDGKLVETENFLRVINPATEQVFAHCPEAELVLSAAVEPGFKDKLGITVITARGKKETGVKTPEGPAVAVPQPEVKAEPKARGRRRKAKQQELQLQTISKGRFEKSEPTLYGGEDLDVPSFIRRNLPLK